MIENTLILILSTDQMGLRQLFDFAGRVKAFSECGLKIWFCVLAIQKKLYCQIKGFTLKYV